MDDLYGFHPTVDYADDGGLGTSHTPGNMIYPADFASSYQSLLSSGIFRSPVGVDQLVSASAMSETSISPVLRGEEVKERRIYSGEVSNSLKAKIAGHPRYPCLLQAYIDCQKVGAPPEIASLLDEIRRENDGCEMNSFTSRIGADPELDEFMESYCEVLVKYKSDLAKPFDEATTFLNKIESQLSNLCKGTSRLSGSADEPAGSSEEECSGGEIEVHELHTKGEDRELKDKLLRKYSGHLSNLKQEFSKKKKKGKLPKEARQTLLDWWNIHYKWPYPTEADKIDLAKSTGLDQKQINNWFINQRKRHWKPSENMQFAVMDSLSAPFYVDD